MGRDVPWKLGAAKLPPAGLRDCVLRVSFMTPNEARQTLRETTHAGMRACAGWRLLEPEAWQQLLDAMGIHYDNPKLAQRRSRKRVDLRSLRRSA